MSVNKILVANRGEIAVRIIRECRALGIHSIAVYSKADAQALHVSLADEAFSLGEGSSSTQTYLNIPKLMDVIKKSGADAVHPGYGFLAENASFSRLIVEAGKIFIGPSEDTILQMGNKVHALRIAKDAGVPTVKGSFGLINNRNDRLDMANVIGFPLLIKASSGGGGRGIRIVRSAEELDQEISLAKHEAKNTFGDDGIYIEQYIDRPRHVEVQVIGDGCGNVITLGERECSLQRRNQKLIEEAPCIGISTKLRQELFDASVAIASRVKYKGVGTIEFLIDRSNFYFIEMNTRVQVEHPVTEWVSGVNIVKQQILISGGMGLNHINYSPRGHAIECRVNAEDPENEFRPSPGKVTNLNMPAGFGVRVDTALFEGYSVPPYYDSLIAKIIVWGEHRVEALNRMCGALKEFQVSGINTTVEFLLSLLNEPDVERGDVDTQFIQRRRAMS